MRHIILCITSLLNHHAATKPVFDSSFLRAATLELTHEEAPKTVCVYPMTKN